MALSSVVLVASPISSIWKAHARQRVLAFDWLAIIGRILTQDNLHFQDNLHKCKLILINVCPLCLRDAESVDYLLSSCSIACTLWNSVLI